MGRSSRAIPTWGILSVALVAETILCAILTAATLDSAVARPPEPASVTTKLPGFVYASASVMKICLVAGVVSAAIALAKRALPRRHVVLGQSADAESGDRREHATRPAIASGEFELIWGTLPAALTPLTPLVGAVAVVIAQTLVDDPEGVSMSDFPLISRTGVLVMLVWIAAALILGITASLKCSRHRSTAVFGVVMNAILIGLFWYFEFYKLGFDQDRWADL